MSVTIIASGDSLRGFPFEKIGGEIWAINYTALHIPRYDKLLCFDAPRPDYPPGNIETIELYGGRWLNYGDGINRDPGKVGNMNSSAAFAINVALQLGHRHITLLGCDNAGERRFFDPLTVSLKYYWPLFDSHFKACMNGLRVGESIVAIETKSRYLPNMPMDRYLKTLK